MSPGGLRSQPERRFLQAASHRPSTAGGSEMPGRLGEAVPGGFWRDPPGSTAAAG